MGPSPVESLISVGSAAKATPAPKAQHANRGAPERFSSALQRAGVARPGGAGEVKEPVIERGGAGATAVASPSHAQRPREEAQESVPEAQPEPSETARTGESAAGASKGAESAAQAKAPALETESAQALRAESESGQTAQAVELDADARAVREIVRVTNPAEEAEADEPAPGAGEPREARATRVGTSHEPTREAGDAAPSTPDHRAEIPAERRASAGTQHETHGPGPRTAAAGSNVESGDVGEAASREILRLAAQAEARAGGAEKDASPTETGRARTTPSQVMERLEGRGSLERLIDAGRPAERAPTQSVARTPDRTNEPQRVTIEASEGEGVLVDAGEARHGSESHQGQGESRGDGRSTQAHANALTAHASKPSNEQPEPYPAPKPGNDATVGLTPQGATATKGAREAARATTLVPGGQDASNVEAAASRGLMAAIQQRGGTVTVRLEPESLGAMRIRMDLSGGVVRATFEVTTPEARDLLGAKLDSLRSSLEAKGLGVERLQVQLTTAGQGGAANNDSSSGEGRWHGSRSSPDAGEGRTRGDAGGGRDGREREPRDRRDAGFAGALGGAWREEWVRVGVDALV